MRLQLKNFGGFTEKSFELARKCAVMWPNGAGKTTLVNAYVFALSGRCLNGFQPRNINAPDDEVTSVTLDGGSAGRIRRVLHANGSTELYVGDSICTQTRLAELFDVDLAVACAYVTVLAEPGTDTEKVRKLLVVAGALQNGRAAELRAIKTKTLAALRDAEKHAATTTIIPERTVAELNILEKRFLGEYEANSNYALTHEGVTQCPTCLRPYSDDDLAHIKKNVENSLKFIKDFAGEYARLIEQKREYERESAEIARAQKIVEEAAKARKDVLYFHSTLQRIDAELAELDKVVIKTALPEHVEVQTEQSLKNGGTRNTCTLTYKGVPLKSINYAKRVMICVEILDAARKAKGLEYLPILVDNAESVEGLDRFDNLISFKVVWG